MKRLPSLNAIRAFEAAARHLSITQAAEELCVTTGAVSRQIRGLEQELGVDLFKRGHRQISLTASGREYYRAVGRTLNALREATHQVAAHGRRKQLKVMAYTTIAVRWLIPRLSSFHAAHPDIEVLLQTSLRPVDFRKEDIDVAIRLGDGQWPGANSHPLVSNVLTPVASPALLSGARRLRKPADLKHFTLLHSMARPDDWHCWLDAVGASDQVDSRSGMFYESSVMAYAAAIEGQGLAIAQYFLVADDLASGKLVQPFRQTVEMGSYTYYILTPAHRPESGTTRTFREWLLGELEGAGHPGG